MDTKKVTKKKASKKVQGSPAKSASKGRSLGSEYAYATEGIKKEAKSIRKKAQSNYLGKSKKTIKNDSLASSSKLTKTRKTKARNKKVK